MSNILIKTLSHIHIGNGVFLQQGNDFLADGNGDESYIYVLNINKLASIIGTDASTIQLWADAIKAEKVDSFIKNKLRGHEYREVALRRIANYANISSARKTLKECIHDGMGRPYIPGSSIKGAIRTAVMATLARPRIAKALETAKDKEHREKIISNMEKKVLGHEAETDVFRHLATGDAFFDKGCEISVTQINLNITTSNKLRDFRKQQIVEAIAYGESSTFRLNTNKEFYEKTRLTGDNDLFRLINQHTKDLVKEEIDYWDGKGIDSEDYVNNMEDILSEINSCASGECVLRIGQASGWRFVTGAWLEEVDDDIFDSEIVPMCRRNNQRYEQYDFPKSRRIDSDSELFGFVKLKIL